MQRTLLCLLCAILFAGPVFGYQMILSGDDLLLDNTRGSWDFDGDGVMEIVTAQDDTGSNGDFTLRVSSFTGELLWTVTLDPVDYCTGWESFYFNFKGFAPISSPVDRDALFDWSCYGSSISNRGVVVISTNTDQVVFAREGFYLTHSTDLNGSGTHEMILSEFLAGGGAFEIWGDPTSSAAAMPASSQFELRGNHPNPFNPSTVMEFTLQISAGVQLNVYDIGGRHVFTEYLGELDAGQHDYTWLGRDGRGRRLPSGVYFYTLQAGGQRQDRKMIMLK